MHAIVMWAKRARSWYREKAVRVEDCCADDDGPAVGECSPRGRDEEIVREVGGTSKRSLASPSRFIFSSSSKRSFSCSWILVRKCCHRPRRSSRRPGVKQQGVRQLDKHLLTRRRKHSNPSIERMVEHRKYMVQLTTAIVWAVSPLVVFLPAEQTVELEGNLKAR